MISAIWIGAGTTIVYLYFTPISAIVYATVLSMIGAIFNLLILDFMAQQTPKGLEASIYALLCGINNAALTLSTLTGAFLLHFIGLNWLIVIATILSLPALLVINKVNFNQKED